MFDEREAAQLEVCRTCLCLRGPFYDSWNGCDRVQPCACDPKQPLWNAFDYNTWAELCQCCSAEVLRSGSRWSPFFCDECKQRVRDYNEREGYCVIPIGRHSLMNGVGLNVVAASKSKAAKTFADGLVGLFGGCDGVWKFHREQLRLAVDALAEPAGVIPLPLFLEHARRRTDRVAAFALLVSAMTRSSKGASRSAKTRGRPSRE